jgi:hypothetical protein
VVAAPTQNQDQALEALRQAEAQRKESDAVARAQKERDEKIAAEEQLRAARAAHEEAVRQEREQAELKRQEEEKKLATVNPAETPATAPTVSPDVARQKAEADAAVRRQAQEEVALRMERLEKDMKNAPPVARTGPAVITPSAQTSHPEVSASKEQRLAELLRRYQADEITPYDYHMERAKIIAEP